MGYRLTGEWGWPARAGYAPDDAAGFLADLTALAALGLTVVGVGPGTEFFPLDTLRGMAASAAGRRALASVDVRIFTAADYVARWNAFFGWHDASGGVAGGAAGGYAVLARMTRQKISRRALARGLGVDASFLSKVLNGTKPWPPGLLERAEAFLAGRPRGVCESAAT
jgi:hypothetical protein